MSHGLLIDNPSGLLVLSADFPCPRFLGKPGLSRIEGPLAHNIQDVSARVTNYWFDLPPAGSALFAQTVPDVGSDVWYTAVLPDQTYSPSGVVVRAYHTNTVAPAPPEVYAFGVGPVPASGDTHGLALFDSAGTRTFDSGHRHFIPSLVVPRPPLAYWGAGVSLASAPSKSCFLLPALSKDSRTYFDIEEQDGQHVTGLEVVYSDAAFCRRGTNLKHSYIVALVQHWYGAPNDGSVYEWGTLSNAAVAVLDASIYD